MDNNTSFAAILGICMFNGLFSPLLQVPLLLAPLWYPEFLPAMPELLFYGSSIMLSTMTLLFAGVPAAIVERLRGTDRDASLTLQVWLTVAIVLSIPAFLRLIGS